MLAAKGYNHVTLIKSWNLHKLDINNAFLHNDLQKEVYMNVAQVFTSP